MDAEIIVNATESEKIEFVKGKIQDIRRNRIAQEKQWFTNIAFLFGNQYFIRDKGGANLAERIWFSIKKITDSKKERRVQNQILVYFRAVLSRMLKMKAVVKVDPDTKEKRDIEAAKVAKEVLEQHWEEVNSNNPYLADDIPGMLMVLKYLFMYQLAFGRGYLKPYFNPNTESSMMRDGEIVRERIGEVETDVLHPLFLFFDPLRRFVIEKKVMSVKTIYEQYGFETPPSEDIYLSDMHKHLLSLIDKTDYKALEDAAVLYEYYELPSKEDPAGRMLICTDKKEGSDTDLPEHYKGRLPYFGFNWFDLFRSLVSQGFVEQLMPGQKEFNFTISRIAEYKKFLAGKLLMPDGARIQQKWSDETGQIIKYQPPYKPEYVTPPNPPEYLFTDLGRIDKGMQDTAMTHEPSLAKAPQGVKSGVALRHLTEKDDMSLSPTTMENEVKLARYAEMVLDIIADTYTEERIIRHSGDSLSPEVKTFLGFDVQGNRRVSITLGSGMPSSTVARQEQILSYIERQVITPEEGREKLEIGDVEGALEDLDKKAAEYENHLITKGEVPVPHEWDRHDIHAEIVRRFMIDTRFRELSAPIQAAAIAHFNVHLQMLRSEIKVAGGTGAPGPPAMPEGAPAGAPVA